MAAADLGGGNLIQRSDHTTKLEFRKFDHRMNRHVLFKEEKMN
uniref:Uncharacterized protein LOC104242970 n=1 Tax=Nicotiana sylvestris TaxID=4096 RepID=A0A1U7YC69_NICSY|nr:PREDICTED: uncharacterized protein LOC104242970 [Nicotiana sylvestris]